MIAEAGIIAFLSFWVLSEYTYDAYFRSYVDLVLLGHATTYTAMLGLGIGLAGSATAALLYKNLRNAKLRLEATAVPKFRGAVEKVVSGLPSVSPGSTQKVTVEPKVSEAPAPSVSPPVTAIVPVPETKELKKDAS
jgi:hypothetical protein